MPRSYQILLSDAEKTRLINRIEQDASTCKDSHQRYADRCANWLQKWEARVDAPKAGQERKPNHTVPLIQWQCFNKLSRDMQALLGDEAEITARPTGPSDSSLVAKVGRYMTSRVFDQMQLVNPLCVFEFRRILNGWAAAYRPWYRREYDVIENGKRDRVCDYEGPGFFPLEPDDLMIPPERGVMSLQDFSCVIQRVRVTVDDLIRGDGTLYQGTSSPEFIKKAILHAQGNYEDLKGDNPVREEREKTEGVDYDAFMSGRRSFWMWRWYGFWRPLKKQKRDAEIDDIEKRLPFEADWCVSYIPGMKEIVGVQDLLELYPKMRRRRPFVESTLIKDGTYRPKGFGALLEDLEDEATANSRLFTAAGELSVWPIVFFKPGGGMKPGSFKLEAGMANPTEDPSSVNVLNLRPNLEYGVARQQDIFAVAERVTGITDQSLGRSIDRPNAPKTATQSLALIEEGNVRAWLDSTILREDMEQIISDFWEMDCDLVPKTQPGLFFRVTEQQANGLFDVSKGGAAMTPKEFGGKYDFRLKFATSVYARQQKKAELLTFYQLSLTNPIIATNPLALWSLTDRVAHEFGIDDFETIVPKPPELDAPQNPDQEWTKMLEGEIVPVHPQDHDDTHLMEHNKQLEGERTNPERDVQAIGYLVKHIIEHQQQKKEKMAVQALTSQLVSDLASTDAGMPSIQPQQPPQAPAQPNIGMRAGGMMPAGGAPNPMEGQM